MKNYNLGLVSISFRNHTPKEILKEMKKSGLLSIEWGSDVHAPQNDLEKVKEVASLQKEYDIVCSSYGTYFKLGETDISQLTDYINAAKVLGTNILRLWCGTKSGKNMTLSERENLINECKKAAKIAKENDVILCMECHQNTFTENLEDTMFLLKSVNSSNFKMYWQPFQWQECNENIKIAKEISPYSEHIHVFNWDKDKRYPLIKAKDEWTKYLKEFSNNKTLLLEFMPDDRIESLEKETEALKMIVGE